MKEWHTLDFRGADKAEVGWDEEEVTNSWYVTIAEGLGIIPVFVQIQQDHHAYIVYSLIMRWGLSHTNSEVAR